MICRICDSPHLDLAIDLGIQPWCNDFLTSNRVGHEEFYPLRLMHCRTCRGVQLDYTVPKEVMFADHTYLSGITQSLSNHFRGIAEDVDARFFHAVPDKSALDIGSNDGTNHSHV